VSFGDDDMKYSTTPELLKTVAAIAVPTASASPTANGTTTASKTGPAVATFTGAGSNVFPGAMMALFVAVTIVTALF
jgi:hypothetical protein